MRWAVRMQQYGFKIIHRKGKDNLVPDTLSRSVPIVEEIAVESKEVPELISVNPGDKWYKSLTYRITNNPLKQAIVVGN